MGVSRSGFYKWKKRDPSRRDINREQMIAAVKEVHLKHRTHGYRWTAAFIRINMGISISDNYAYKCFRFLGMRAETTHMVKRKPRKERDKYPNLIYSTWETVDRPRQVIVSDMTVFKFWVFYFEVTFYFEVFTKELLTHKVAERRGSRDQYIDGLDDVRKMLRGSPDPTLLHTDQGSVYTSLDRYRKFYNEQRPCFAIGYDTPLNYRKRFEKDELPHKNTFADREPSPEPKFVKERKKRSEKEKDKPPDNRPVHF